MRPEPRLALLGDSATPNLEGFGGGGWLVYRGGSYSLCSICCVVSVPSAARLPHTADSLFQLEGPRLPHSPLRLLHLAGSRLPQEPETKQSKQTSIINK